VSLFALHHLLWLLPSLVAAAFALLWAFRRRRAAVALLGGVKTNASAWRQRVAGLALALAVLCAAIAALRPIGGMILTDERMPARNLILLLDVSRSMAAVDSDSMSRIEAAKLFARGFVDRRPTDRIGMLSFAGASFPECPTTLDRRVLNERIAVQKAGALPSGGTDLAVALEEATALLTEEPPPGSALVMLSDGDALSGDARAAAEILAERGIPIFVLGFGEPRTSNTLSSGAVTTADHDALRELAAETAGHFVHALPRSIDAQLMELDSRLDTIEFSGDGEAELRQRPFELYAYPLAVALALLLLRWLMPVRTKSWTPLAKSTAALAFLVVATSPKTSMAQETPELPEVMESPDTIQSLVDAALVEASAESLPLVVLFTGSDWSEVSGAFQLEVLDHPVFQAWAETSAMVVELDLRRGGMPDEDRRAHRRMASRYDIVAYPTALFLSGEGEELGRLGHDEDGPRSWVDRANAIIAGDATVSDSPASIKFLPRSDRDFLQEEAFGAEERAVRHFNFGLDLEKEDPELSAVSEDRFDLLTELYQTAVREAPSERADIRASAEHRLGLLEHRVGRLMLPPLATDTEMVTKFTERFREEIGRSNDATRPFRKAIRSCERALPYYRRAIALTPGDPALSSNLMRLHQDIQRLQDVITYLENRQKAITLVATGLQQETRFLRSLQRDVTTKRPVNDEDIVEARDTVELLLSAAEAIEGTVLLEEDSLEDIQLALEDMELVPDAHASRDLEASKQHLKNAYDHLVDPQQMQQQGQGSEDGEPGEGEGEGDGQGEGGKDRPEGDRDEDDGDQGDDGDEDGQDSDDAGRKLDRAGKDLGDLRERMLDRLGRESKPMPPGRDH